MRKFSAIKFNYTLNIYFPRLATQAPHFSGLASERGTRERAWNGRFCHFFSGRGFKPGRGHETKKCCFFFFLFVLRKEKPDNHTKPSIIPPRVFEGSGVIFFLLFHSHSPDYRRPPRGFSITFFGPPAIKTISQLKFSHCGGANKGWLSLLV